MWPVLVSAFVNTQRICTLRFMHFTYVNFTLEEKKHINKYRTLGNDVHTEASRAVGRVHCCLGFILKCSQAMKTG